MNPKEKENSAQNRQDRESNRVPVHFPLSYSPISAKEFKSIKDIYCAHSTSDREGRAALLQDISTIKVMEKEMEESLGPGFVKMWRLIDYKLNLIYAELNKERSGEWKQETVCKELGGRGMQLKEYEETFKTNDKLKLMISPPTYPPFSIAVLGTVKRVIEKKDDEGNPYYETAVAFDAINKDDQEILFGYLFKRQREIIRSGNE